MSERTERTMGIAEPLARRGRMDSATDAFVVHRKLLFTVAYEMLGSASDAEDVLQETWLRWVGVDLDTVRDQRAYLVRITTRQALSRLRTLRRRKESYVGPWLPEPLLTAPDVAEDVQLADSVSMAMLLVLETLTPSGGSFLRTRPETHSGPSSGRSKRAICNRCSTSSRRMSSSWVTVAESCRPYCRRSWGPAV
jgi:hypothetical protein